LRPLVEFQITSVCEKNRKVYGGRCCVIVSLAPEALVNIAHIRKVKRRRTGAKTLQLGIKPRGVLPVEHYIRFIPERSGAFSLPTAVSQAHRPARLVALGGAHEAHLPALIAFTVRASVATAVSPAVVSLAARMGDGGGV
jgi:hypothetical protein